MWKSSAIEKQKSQKKYPDRDGLTKWLLVLNVEDVLAKVQNKKIWDKKYVKVFTCSIYPFNVNDRLRFWYIHKQQMMLCCRTWLWCGSWCSVHPAQVCSLQPQLSKGDLPTLHHSHWHVKYPGCVPGCNGHCDTWEPPPSDSVVDGTLQGDSVQYLQTWFYVFDIATGSLPFGSSMLSFYCQMLFSCTGCLFWGLLPFCIYSEVQKVYWHKIWD